MIDRGVVSLYELMHRYRLDHVCTILTALQTLLRDCVYQDVIKTELSSEQIAGLKYLIEALGDAMRLTEADKSLLAQFDSFQRLLEKGAERRPSVVEANLRQIMLGVDVVLRNRLFMFVPEAHAPYYMNLEQFGESVVAMFPEAIPDMLEASTCYAAGRSTACVFHSMRAAEFGLRHIANEMGVEIMDGKKPCPIEFGTWEKVLIAIDTKRTEVRREPKGAEHNEKTRTYASLADSCSYLKDIFRNDTMHSRRMYSEEEALVAMNTVIRFMNLLAGCEYAPSIDPGLAEASAKITEWTKTLGTSQQ